jgi:hypothetical protein
MNACVSESPVMIRYDYAPDDYNEGLHPASHLHIGFESEIRIGCKCIMLPQTFILKIVRQCYPNEWYALLNVENLFNAYKNILETHINELDKIDAFYFNLKILTSFI